MEQKKISKKSRIYTSLKSNFNASKPVVIEKINPKRITLGSVSIAIMILSSSNAIAPKRAGIAIKNEKRAAWTLLTPNRRAAEMVMPEREMPGSIATAWAMPIMSAVDKMTSFTGCFPDQGICCTGQHKSGGNTSEL